MKRPEQPKFAKESDLCAAFIADVKKRQEWKCYPETAGWDILVCRQKDGAQVGIQAKLRLNAKVVAQCVDGRLYSYIETGPHYRAILVPRYEVQNDLGPICRALGLTIITYNEGASYSYMSAFNPTLPDRRWGSSGDAWFEWCPLKNHSLPDYVPDVTAGSSAPVQLTDWKIKAIKLAVLTELRPVTRADFKALKLDPRRWTDGWLKATPAGYVRSDRFPDLAAAHPRNYAEIKADFEKWGAELPATLLSVISR